MEMDKKVFSISSKSNIAIDASYNVTESHSASKMLEWIIL